MARRPTLRLLGAFALALSSLAVIAAPVAAATCSGTCGTYVISDQGPAGPKGAVCKYETASYDLDFISVRPPKMYGPFAYKTKVQWYFKILRSTDFGASWMTAHTSSFQTAQASTTSAAYAGHGFSRRYWYAPDPNPTGWFKVTVIMIWRNSGGVVIGNDSVVYHHYKGIWNGASDHRLDYCLNDW